MNARAAVAALALLLAAGAQDAPAAEPALRVSGQFFLNASHLDRDASTSGDGWGVDLKRSFLTLDYRFSDTWSAQLRTDIQWQRHQSPSDLWLRHAYLQRRLEHGWLRLGSAPTPWIAGESAREGFRYVQPGLIAGNGLGDPADYGAHLEQQHGAFTWAASVVTGAGFKKPRLGNRADVELRAAWVPHKGLELALGGYHGTRAQDTAGRAREHTATRWHAMLSWVGARTRAGAQAYRADNWNRITQPGSDAGRGWSSWASWHPAPAWAVFTRHERNRPSLQRAPASATRYSHLGLEWQPNRQLRLAAVGKRVQHRSAARHGRDHEAGLWAQLAF